MHYIRFLLTKTSSAKFESIFPLGSYFIYIFDFFSICKWQLNEHLLFYCLNNILFDALLTYSSQKSKPIIFFCGRRSIHLFKIQISATFDFIVMIIVIGKYMWHFFSSDYTIVTADVITCYIVCLSFPGSQAKFSWVCQGY